MDSLLELWSTNEEADFLLIVNRCLLPCPGIPGKCCDTGSVVLVWVCSVGMGSVVLVWVV